MVLNMNSGGIINNPSYRGRPRPWKLKWYMVLEKYGLDNTFFINEVSSIKQAFNEGKLKIDEIKN